MQVSLTPKLEELVREKVESGLYDSASEVIREALRLWKERRDLFGYTVEELRQLVQEGIDSGVPVDGPTAMKALLAKYQK